MTDTISPPGEGSDDEAARSRALLSLLASALDLWQIGLVSTEEWRAWLATFGERKDLPAAVRRRVAQLRD